MESRLTYSVKDTYEVECANCPMDNRCTELHDCVNVLADRLGRIEDKMETKYIVELKARVGDTVWVIHDCKDVDKRIDSESGLVECPFESECSTDTCTSSGSLLLFESHITSVIIGDNITTYFIDGILTEFSEYAFGATVFTNKDEAENALNCLEDLIDGNG